MQNERLFKKIKDTAENASAVSGEWDPERIWAKVERRQKKQKFSLWRPYAAASVTLIIGLSLWFLSKYKENNLAVIKGSNLSKAIIKANAVGDSIDLQGSVSDNSHKKLTAHHDLRNKATHKAIRQMRAVTGNQNKDKTLAEDHVNAQVIDTAGYFAGAGNLIASVEKEEVMETNIPELPHDTLTPLLQMFEHAKRVREERKMIVRLDDKNRSMDLWLFDHAAFVEHHLVNEPKLFLQKR